MLPACARQASAEWIRRMPDALQTSPDQVVRCRDCSQNNPKLTARSANAPYSYSFYLRALNLIVRVPFRVFEQPVELWYFA